MVNSPAVLFAAIILPVLAVSPGWRWPSGALTQAGVRVGLLLGGVMCMAALAGAVHRAALGLAVFGLIVWLIGGGWRRWQDTPPGLRLLAGLALLAVVLLFGDQILGVGGQVLEKTRQVGTNARLAEAAAVLEQIGRSLPSMLFGDGWGALIDNPAVGGMRVSYTHTFVSYLLLKTGVGGLIAVHLYLLSFLPAALRAWRCRRDVALAALAPLASGLLVHTAFKFLDFGLLLALIGLSAAAPSQTRKIGINAQSA